VKREAARTAVLAALLLAGWYAVPALFTGDTAGQAQAHVVWPWLAAMQPVAGAVFALDGVLIGAGSGAVAIEAARLMPRGAVYAVERDPEQLACLERNIARHHASNVLVVAGEAPEALAGLPQPESVFVGGSGGRLREVLAAVQVRLRPGGRLVLNLTTLDHLAQARAWLAASGMGPQELVQLQVARAVPIADDERLAALNPVWILAATKLERTDG